MSLDQLFSSIFSFDWRLLLIPLITGLIGYGTNWVAIRFLFRPLSFIGMRVPGLKEVAPLFPRKLRQIPGIVEGRIGWQGIIPSRSAKMGSIAAEKGVAKIADEREFYEVFDPDKIATHMVTHSQEEIRELTNEILRSEYPDLWQTAPPQVRELIHERVQSQLPQIADTITDQIGENIDELLDVNMMITNHMDENPQLINRLFMEVGERELTFIIRSGFYIGTFLGTFTIPLFLYIDEWWVLPVAGVIVGYTTNWIALKIIFSPVRERRIGPFRLQGLFIKRQPIAAEKWSEIVADEVVTIGNVAKNLMHGSQSDRTRKMIVDAIRPEVDRAVGIAAPIIRMTSEPEQYERVRERFAREGIEKTMEPLQDPAFNEDRSEAIREMITSRVKSLPPEGFVELLRPAFEEDEWMLIVMGGVLGFVAGWIQLLVVTGI